MYVSSFYTVTVLDIKVGGKSIEASSNSYSSGRFIVDSGTTDSYLPSSLKTHFESTFAAVTGLAYSTTGASCEGYSDEDLKNLPNLQIVLKAAEGGNVTLEFTPDQYIVKDGHKRCSSLFLTEKTGGGT